MVRDNENPIVAWNGETFSAPGDMGEGSGIQILFQEGNMTTINLSITGATAQAEVNGILTGGTDGVEVFISYDAQWEGLQKTLVCSSDVGCRYILGVENMAVVAPEVLQWRAYGKNELWLGVEGRTSDGSLILTSTMAYCGKILPGANTKKTEMKKESGECLVQILQMIGNLQDLTTTDRSSLVAGINELSGKVQMVNSGAVTETNIGNALGYVPRKAVYNRFTVSILGTLSEIKSEMTGEEVRVYTKNGYSVYANVVISDAGAGTYYVGTFAATNLEGMVWFSGIANQFTADNGVVMGNDISVSIGWDGDKWVFQKAPVSAEGGRFLVTATWDEENDEKINIVQSARQIANAAKAGKEIVIDLDGIVVEPQWWSLGENDGTFIYYVHEGPGEEAMVALEYDLTAETVGGLAVAIPASSLTVNGKTYTGFDEEDIDMTDSINAMIDAKLGVIENGTY